MYDSDMTKEELRDLCNLDMYPPHFDIQVSGERDSPKDCATFKFTGSTKELQSQVVLKCYTGKFNINSVK